jgi:hypothetical protein
MSRVNLKNLFRNVSKKIGKIGHFGKSGHLRTLNTHIDVIKHFQSFHVKDHIKIHLGIKKYEFNYNECNKCFVNP